MKIFPDKVEENLLEAILDYLEEINRIAYPKEFKTPREALLKDLFQIQKERIKYQFVFLDIP